MDKGQAKLQVCPGDIVAYFDFDGTITRCDTLLPFLIFAFGYVKILLKLPFLLAVVTLYGLKFIDNEEAKQRTLSIMASGKSFSFMDSKAREFAIHRLDNYIKPEIYTKLEYHLEHKHNIVLVSANLALYLNYWAKRHHVNGVIATEIEFIDGKCTGRLKTRNCYAGHKVNRINEYLEDNAFHYHYSFGYGNSRGDYELLDYVNEGYWVKGANIISWAEQRENKI